MKFKYCPVCGEKLKYLEHINPNKDVEAAFYDFEKCYKCETEFYLQENDKWSIFSCVNKK